MNRLLKLLNDYYSREFGDDSVIPTLPTDGVIALAYTDTEDGCHTLQTSYDTNREAYIYTVDGMIVGVDPISLDDFMVDLEYCEYDDFIREVADLAYEEVC